MYNVEFNYKDNVRRVQCASEETLRTICKRYCRKYLLDINSIHFLYIGKDINFELNFAQIATEFDLNRKIITLNVMDRNMGDSNIYKAKEIICSECYDSALLSIEKCYIKIHDCKNGHTVGVVLLDEIEENQSIDFTQIKCENCRIYSRGYTYQNEFYRCNTCKMNLCPICEIDHDKTHIIISYDRRNYVCDKHRRSYHSFCKDCKINLCALCEKAHETHKLIYLHKMMKHDKSELTDKLKKIKTAVDIFVRDVKLIINRLNLIKENMKCFYELNFNIIHNYDERNINYQILKNINEIYKNTKILDVLDLINNEKDVYEKFKHIYDLYQDVAYKPEINMVYSITQLDKNLKIFGEEFVKANKDKCKMVFKAKEQELKSYISVKDMLKDKIKIKLTNVNEITDMSFIFYDCSNLISCNDLSKWNTSKIKDMHKIFYGCSILKSLPDISFWFTSKVKDICGMFYNCISLSSIPDISDWDLSKVTNLSGLFCGCEKIKSLPDISRWDTSNVTNMNGLFCGCSNLEKIPNIEKWFTDKVKDMSGLFCGCGKINKIPDISKWNIEKVKDLSGMFFSCSELLALPDISIWNTDKVKNMTGMFADCMKLSSLPDISKWKIHKNTQIVNMFKGCQETLEIPDKFRLHINSNKQEEEEDDTE